MFKVDVKALIFVGAIIDGRDEYKEGVGEKEAFKSLNWNTRPDFTVRDRDRVHAFTSPSSFSNQSKSLPTQRYLSMQPALTCLVSLLQTQQLRLDNTVVPSSFSCCNKLKGTHANTGARVIMTLVTSNC
jgi:hypothetical protein